MLNNKFALGTYEINLGTEFTNVLSASEGEEKLGDYYQTAIEAYTCDNPVIPALTLCRKLYNGYSFLYLSIK